MGNLILAGVELAVAILLTTVLARDVKSRATFGVLVVTSVFMAAMLMAMFYNLVEYVRLK